MVLIPFMVLDNVQVWHKSTIGVLCRYAASWPTAILEIFSYEPDIFRVAYISRQPLHKERNNTDRIVSSSLIFYLIYIVCQIPMVEIFATNRSHKLPFYVDSPGCKCSEHRCIEHLVGGFGLLGLLSYTTYSKKSLNK